MPKKKHYTKQANTMHKAMGKGAKQTMRDISTPGLRAMVRAAQGKSTPATKARATRAAAELARRGGSKRRR